ncbi:MAG: 50S ribosomal protein L32 [Bacteroidetes bacterium]|nr:MAG: 50S ribosomal protein L32 [Bacteroidota bacterium]
MPNPKRRHSSTRRDKRRTHYKATPQTITICPETGVAHTRHTAYVVDGNLYYKGKMIVENYKKVAEV